MEDNTFKIVNGPTGSVIRPDNANHLIGSLLFPFSSCPLNASHFTSAAVDFNSSSAKIRKITILSGKDTVFQMGSMVEDHKFSKIIDGHQAKIHDSLNGLALCITAEFEHFSGQLEIFSVGAGIALKPEKDMSLKFDNGTWTTEVRGQNDSNSSAQSSISFTTKFHSTPRITVGVSKADVDQNYGFRVKVYATDVTKSGFTIHADSWGDTKLYSCGVSWTAMGH